MAGKALNHTPPQLSSIERPAPFSVGKMPVNTDPSLAPEAGQLSPALQDIARRYVAARRKSGEAILESARWLHDAKQIAKHGEWKTFLDATGTSEDAAERLRNIHIKAMSEPGYAEAIASNFLTESGAALLARPSTPPEVIEQVLSAPEPPKVAEIQQAIRDARTPQTPQIAEFDNEDQRQPTIIGAVSQRYGGPGQPEPDPWPAAPEGWRWTQTGPLLYQLTSSDGWTTNAYSTRQAVIEEAAQISCVAYRTTVATVIPAPAAPPLVYGHPSIDYELTTTAADLRRVAASARQWKIDLAQMQDADEETRYEFSQAVREAMRDVISLWTAMPKT